ncbi:hypothetical protein Droror1_Dr00012856 [Drosera rotundifolia]
MKMSSLHVTGMLIHFGYCDEQINDLCFYNLTSTRPSSLARLTPIVGCNTLLMNHRRLDSLVIDLDLIYPQDSLENISCIGVCVGDESFDLLYSSPQRVLATHLGSMLISEHFQFVTTISARVTQTLFHHRVYFLHCHEARDLAVSILFPYGSLLSDSLLSMQIR